MKLKISILLLGFIAAIAHAATNDLTGLLQQGLFEEEANRNLDAAISNYQMLAGQFDKDRQVAATAIFRLGECYRKLGKTNEAVVEYQRILRDFSDQGTLATLSQQNLTGLGVSTGTQASKNLSEDAQALQQQIVSAQAQLAQSETMLKNLKSMNSGDLRQALPSLVPDDQFNTLMQELDLAEQQLINLHNNYAPDHPKYRAAQDLVNDLHKKVDNRIDGILLGLQAKINAETAYLNALTAKSEGASGPSSVGSQNVTDEEQKEIRRIQVMIQDSPDLINASIQQAGTPLQTAAWAGQLVVARYLLDHGADVDRRVPGESGFYTTATPLCIAAMNGHKAVVELLLAHGANVNGGGGLNPLFEAISKDYQEVVNVLIANKADVNFANNSDSGKTPLMLAVSRNQTNMAQLLLSHGANVNAKNKDGRTALFFAAYNNFVDVAKILMASGADVDARDNNDETPLHGAAFSGNAEMISFLIEHGASVDATNIHNATPLVIATRDGKTDAVRVLLEHKADPNHLGTVTDGGAGRENWTARPVSFAVALKNGDVLRLLLNAGAIPGMALFSAVEQNYSEGVRLLLDHGADPNNAPPPIDSLLNRAVEEDRDPQIVKSLLDKGADPNVRDQNGDTLLMASYKPDIIRWLIEHKADVNARAKDGRTALMFRRNNIWPEDPEKYRILLDNGANPDLQDADGNTALHHFVSAIQTNIIALLLEHKANPNIQNNDGLTPLDLAEQQLKMEPPIYGLPGTITSTESRPTRGQILGEIVDMLTTGGALANLPKRDRIEVRRGSSYVMDVAFKDAHDWNHFSLLESIAIGYGLLGQQTAREWRATTDTRQSSFNLNLRFPDFKKVIIYRRTGNSSKQTTINVDVENLLNSGDCSRDIPLQWGDVVEIPETDHPVEQRWPGLADSDTDAMSKCLARQVTIKIKGESTTVKLAPEFTPANNNPGDVMRTLVHASFMLRSVLDNSKLIRVSSDLAHVKVTRRNSITGKTEELTVDCTSPGGVNLWLCDGDVIEVPEK